MGLFGKSMEDKVNEALEKLRKQFPQASVSATVDGKVVTLRGQAPDMATKGAIMNAFNGLVETDNTLNQIAIPQPTPVAAGAAFPSVASAPAATAGAPGAQLRIHEVVSGDTLSALAKKYYGNASQYMKIFNANKDQLNDPDKIKVGQKLKIPE